MSNLSHRQSKIQDKRKQTLFRDFVMEICSWYPLVLYKHKGMITIFDKAQRIGGIVPHKEFSAGRDGLTQQGQDYIPSKTFFENIKNLVDSIAFPNLIHFTENENADYAHCVLGSKNIYLSYTVINDVENACYSFSVKAGSRNVYNSLMVRDHSENVYSSVGVLKGYNIFYSKYIHNCSDIWFSSNLVGCKDCILCTNLENKSYCIKNIQYNKEIFLQKKQEILSQKDRFLLGYQDLSNKGANYGSDQVIGNFLINSTQVDQGYMMYEIQHSRNAILIGGDTLGEQVYDVFLNTPPINNIYASLSVGTESEHIYFSLHIDHSQNIYFSMLCSHCSFCFGCIGLQNKSYCIFNKQYSKEERYEKVDEIFTKMDAEGTLGQFFPATINPFYFNDTAAYLIDPTFTKEEVTAKGYLWRDEPVKVDIPADAKIVAISGLTNFEGRMVGTEFFPSTTDRKNSIPTNAIWYINPEILKYVIKDEQGNYYRIIPMEYKFLMKHGLPLPRKHWLERMKENFRIS